MMTFALNHLSVFPAWMQQPMLVLIGLVVMASLLACLIKIMQTAAMRIFFVSLHRAIDTPQRLSGRPDERPHPAPENRTRGPVPKRRDRLFDVRNARYRRCKLHAWMGRPALADFTTEDRRSVHVRLPVLVHGSRVEGPSRSRPSESEELTSKPAGASGQARGASALRTQIPLPRRMAQLGAEQTDGIHTVTPDSNAGWTPERRALRIRTWNRQTPQSTQTRSPAPIKPPPYPP